MLKLLLTVAPLAAGAALSPTILLVQLRLISGPRGATARAWALAGGAAVVLTVITVLAAGASRHTGGASTSDTQVAVVELVIAALLLAIGGRGLIVARRARAAGAAADEPKETATEGRLGRFFALGVGMMATNFSSLALYFPAVHLVGVSDVDTAGRAVVLLFLAVMTMLPAVLPPLSTRFGFLRPGLERVDRLMQRVSPHLPWVAIAFGAYLAVLGLTRLL
jgi:hypothetical protein